MVLQGLKKTVNSVSGSLVLLALRTSPDIVTNFLINAWPPKVPADEIRSPGDSHMACDLAVVLRLEDRTLEVSVVGDLQGIDVIEKPVLDCVVLGWLSKMSLVFLVIFGGIFNRGNKGWYPSYNRNAIKAYNGEYKDSGKACLSLGR